jgi:hypothetical protein
VINEATNEVCGLAIDEESGIATFDITAELL